MTSKHKPAFSGHRLTLLDWQIADLERMLGRHANEFDVYAFVSELDDSLANSGDIVPPVHQQHRWIQELLYDEVKRRGLPLVKTLRQADSWTLAVCPHIPKCGSSWRCHQLQQIALHKTQS